MINLEVFFLKIKKKYLQKFKSSVESLFFIRKDILCDLFFKNNFFQMLAATTPQGVHSEGQILGDSFVHFDRYGVNDTRKVGFQNLNRSWFVRIDLGLYVAPMKKV